MRLSPSLTSWMQVGPLALALLFFFGIPLLMIIFVSFCQYDTGDIIFEFTLDNYRELFSSSNTYKLYFNSLKYTAIVWAITLTLGFWISYYLVYYVKSVQTQIVLFLICTIPFLTSLIIRMISWIPILGREGLVNRALLSTGLVDQPIDQLLYSDFSVIIAYVHLYTLFMIVPIFNAMARIDKAVLTAARDSGATPLQVLTNVIIPLTRSGMALGTIFVVALVMGDFFVVRVMSGGQRASVVSALFNQVSSLAYPAAAASAVILVLFVSVVIALILRVVDVRKELLT